MLAVVYFATVVVVRQSLIAYFALLDDNFLTLHIFAAHVHILARGLF